MYYPNYFIIAVIATVAVSIYQNPPYKTGLELLDLVRHFSMMNRVLKALHWSDQKSWDVDGNLVIVKVLKLIVIKSLIVYMILLFYF